MNIGVVMVLFQVSSTNDKIKICCNTKSEVLFQAVSLVID